MRIKSVNFADIFKEKVIKTVQIMLDNNERYRALDSIFSSFIVSLDASYSKKLFHVFSGTELGFENIDEVFLFVSGSQ